MMPVPPELEPLLERIRAAGAPDRSTRSPADVAEALRFLLRLSPQAVVRELVLERLGLVRGELSAF